MLVAGLVGALVFLAGSGFGRSARLAEPLPALADRLLVSAGLGINEVMLDGHRFATDAEIYDALALDKAGSLLRFDVIAARDRIQSLSWVETATIVRVLPDKLRIQIQERRASAIWDHNGKTALVDRTGRVLAFLAGGGLPNLPRIAGAGAPAAYSALAGAIEPHESLRKRLEVARRVGERRWTLELAGGVSVHLPPDRDGEALLRLARQQQTGRILDKGSQVIDLRQDGLVAVRPAPGLAPAAGAQRLPLPTL